MPAHKHCDSELLLPTIGVGNGPGQFLAKKGPNGSYKSNWVRTTHFVQ